MKVLLTTLHSKYVHASLALPSLAAYCGDLGCELVIEEYSVHQPKELLLARITAHEAEVICFSVYLWNRQLTLELVSCLKKIAPQVRLVLGGPEVSFEESSFFSFYPLDALINGEGEGPLRQLLCAWQTGSQPTPHAGLRTRDCPDEMGWSQVEPLDEIPSPFAAGLVDLGRGLVYYESSRGCPYHCGFCVSGLERGVRSFSLARIKNDLQLMMDSHVPIIKFVDRTFNYDGQRAREIFRFILARNHNSRFHFEIGGHLLDQTTLDLLAEVPPEVFQFEIGVQSTYEEPLNRVSRHVSHGVLEDNIRWLCRNTNIHIHLDLIAGLPGDSYCQILESLNRTDSLKADHLQLETLKLLPGTALRGEALSLGLEYDPKPPYSLLRSPQLDFSELERLRGIGSLYDRIVNSHRFTWLTAALRQAFSGVSLWLEDLDHFWRQHDLYGQQRSLHDLNLLLADYLEEHFSGQQLAMLRERLARDYANHQRVVSGSQPKFFVTNLSPAEQNAVRAQVKQQVDSLPRSGKLQYFAARFRYLPDCPGEHILIFIYLTRTGSGLQVVELFLRAD